MALISLATWATEIIGTVKDAATGEEIIGALIVVKDTPSHRATTGLDGSFRLNTGNGALTLVCSCMGYNTREVTVHGDGRIDITLQGKEVALNEVSVVADNPGKTETGARLLERKATHVMNVMSAKAMELSPDITIGNVIQRMSGVTVERNSSGEGQYAILRGMDKRYNYTLVNGVKIPSPDNKNRFVPLDLFPSEMLDRLEVSKSLTANMEGDGIGGAVNMVMKDAPSTRQLTASLSTGYNAMYLRRRMMTFDKGEIAHQSPYEAQGKPDNYSVAAQDFTTANLHTQRKAALPDVNASLSYGDRFGKGRLGVMVGASLQHNNRGKESEVYYMPGSTIYGIQERIYSTAQTRAGAHLKLDYKPCANHKLMWYNGYMDMQEEQVRQMADDKSGSTRLKYTHQYIFNSTLKGQHQLLNRALSADWSAVFSRAYSQTPDQAEFNMTGSHLSNTNSATRRWEHNSDRDWAGYLNLSYKHQGMEYRVGGMFRDKQRTSFFNEYTFDSSTGTAHPQYAGTDWNNLDELQLKPRLYGNIGDPLNYDAGEQIGAVYGMVQYEHGLWHLGAGVRAEHTTQSYKLLFPRDTDPEGEQRYWDVLPSAHIKYTVHPNAQLHLSYCRSTNRPSFFEIVPYSIINEDYKEKGNPQLEHTVADNVDLRYEFFPKGSEQFMLGLFYKHLQDPIEYGLTNEGQDTYYKPMNYGNATNMGLEADVMKYFSWLGIKANYTYTHSSITTDKRTMQGSEVVSVKQKRPLFGQAAHVANVSLLLKDTRYGWEGQIAYCYTGKRLSDISNWYNDDIWEKGYHQLDISAEKHFERSHITLFAKASNLLDTPITRIINPSAHTEKADSKRDSDGQLLERKELHGQSLTIGIRWSL